MTPPLTGVFSLSFFRFTAGQRGALQKLLHSSSPPPWQHHTNLGQNHFLHVWHRCGILHVFGQVFLRLLLRLLRLLRPSTTPPPGGAAEQRDSTPRWRNDTNPFTVCRSPFLSLLPAFGGRRRGRASPLPVGRAFGILQDGTQKVHINTLLVNVKPFFFIARSLISELRIYYR